MVFDLVVVYICRIILFVGFIIIVSFIIELEVEVIRTCGIIFGVVLTKVIWESIVRRLTRMTEIG